jgi:hypothetical protein
MEKSAVTVERRVLGAELATSGAESTRLKFPNQSGGANSGLPVSLTYFKYVPERIKGKATAGGALAINLYGCKF